MVHLYLQVNTTIAMRMPLLCTCASHCFAHAQANALRMRAPLLCTCASYCFAHARPIIPRTSTIRKHASRIIFFVSNIFYILEHDQPRGLPGGCGGHVVCQSGDSLMSTSSIIVLSSCWTEGWACLSFFYGLIPELKSYLYF